MSYNYTNTDVVLVRELFFKTINSQRSCKDNGRGFGTLLSPSIFNQLEIDHLGV